MAEVDLSRVQVTLRGSQEDLDAVDGENLTATLLLTASEPGDYEGALSVDLPAGVTLAEDVWVTVTVTAADAGLEE